MDDGNPTIKSNVIKLLKLLLERLGDNVLPDVDVSNWQLVKKNVATGEVFEILEGGKDVPTTCIERTLGIAPEESYAMAIPLKEN